MAAARIGRGAGCRGQQAPMTYQALYDVGQGRYPHAAASNWLAQFGPRWRFGGSISWQIQIF